MMPPIVSPPNEPPPPPPRRPWAWLIPALLAAALYAHTLGGTFIYDDRFHAQTDRRLHDPGGWRQYLTEGYVPGGVDHLWRPLVSFSFLLQRELTGDRAWPMHLVNILLHAAAAALVAQFARRLTDDDHVGLIAGLLFAAHPVHVEGVAYLVGRADVLCTIGTLAALTLMLGPLTKPRALAIFACTALAVLSKEPGLLVPPMLIAVWLLRRARGVMPSPGERAAGRMLLLLLLFAVSAYVVYREHILPWYWETNLLDYATQPMMRSGPRDRALIPIALLGRAVVLLAVPIKLSIEYGLGVITSHQSMTDPYLYAGAIALILATCATITAWRRRAWTVLFLLFCAGLTYFMVSNVKIIGVVFAERLLYLPSAFVLILLAMALVRLPRGATVTIVALLVVGWGVRTTTYAARWNDRLTFYERSVADQPRSARLRVLLAGELIDRGDIEQARRVIDDGLALAPEYWKLWVMAARIAIEQGRLTDVPSMIERAWKLDPFPGDMVFVEDLFARRRERAQGTTIPTPQP
jgi:4-amino-4-deoxy-L-arabinose transferase-like glycosyltransferase